MDFLWPLLFILVAAAAGAAVWMRRGGPALPASPTEPTDDLRSLGLSPARPRSASTVDPDARRPSLPRAEPPTVTDATPHTVLRDGTWAHADAVRPLLTAFATVLDGPVAVLTVADGVASVDALAEASMVPRLPQRRLSAAGTAALRAHVDGAFVPGEAAADALLAFRSAGAPAPPTAAARHLSPDRLIVAGGVLDDETLALADRFADLIAALDPAPDAAEPTEELAPASGSDALDDAATVEPEPIEVRPERAGPPDADAHHAAGEAPADDLAELDEAEGAEAHPAEAEGVEAPSGHAAPRSGRGTRPISRTALLAGEIASSRQADQPLAFALVTRADAEAALAGGDAEAATAALCDALRAYDSVRRAEPFGDLVVGVFLDADALVAVRWTRALHTHEVPLHVGLVAPADYDAAEVRADAMRALQEAWTAGETVVQAG